jgi:hypothetical protein
MSYLTAKVLTMTDKPTREEMRETLSEDPIESLQSTYLEYMHPDEEDTSGFEPSDLATAELIEAVLDLMEEAGDLKADHTFTLPELARELGINPKVARDKMRRAILKSANVPSTIEASKGWTFKSSDRPIVANLIKLTTKQ